MVMLWGLWCVYSHHWAAAHLASKERFGLDSVREGYGLGKVKQEKMCM